MNYSNELKVGIAIVVSVLIFFLGTRFFEDIPLFKGTYVLNTQFSDARGMIPGNAVRISGVKIGSVLGVELDPETTLVKIQMRLNSSYIVPEGSTTEITGIDALGAVQLVITPGPIENPAIQEGGFVPGVEDGDIFASLTEKAPALIDQVDSVLVGLDQTLSYTDVMLQPGGDLNLLLTSLKNSAVSVESLLKQERRRLSHVLANVDTLTGELSTLSGSAGDSLAQLTGNINELMDKVELSLVSLDSTMQSLDSIVGKIDRGEGTVGLLINDDALYHKIDSTVTNMNALLVDLKENPVKYMRALRLVDIF
ncbi:MAG: MlaD family protein [Rhodothermales bacterium]